MTYCFSFYFLFLTLEAIHCNIAVCIQFNQSILFCLKSAEFKLMLFKLTIVFRTASQNTHN